MKEALIPVAEALARVLASADDAAGGRWVALEEAFGRTLARDLVAAANAAAVRQFGDGRLRRCAPPTSPRRPRRLKLIGESAAGRAFAGAVGAGEAVRIFTGAPIPEGADAVVIQEDARREGERVVVAVAARPGDNIRVAGLDFAAGETLLSAGTAARPRARSRSPPPQIIARCPCAAVPGSPFWRPATNSCAPGEPLGPAQIVASNNFCHRRARRGQRRRSARPRDRDRPAARARRQDLATRATPRPTCW